MKKLALLLTVVILGLCFAGCEHSEETEKTISITMTTSVTVTEASNEQTDAKIDISKINTISNNFEEVKALLSAYDSEIELTDNYPAVIKLSSYYPEIFEQRPDEDEKFLAFWDAARSGKDAAIIIASDSPETQGYTAGLILRYCAFINGEYYFVSDSRRRMPELHEENAVYCFEYRYRYLREDHSEKHGAKVYFLTDDIEISYDEIQSALLVGQWVDYKSLYSIRDEE